MAKLSQMSLKILEVMKRHPGGITEGEIREKLRIPATDQANFGRRRRELNYMHVIEKRRAGPRVLYVYKGPRDRPKDVTPISLRLQAETRHKAKGRCGMCGRSIEKHGIVLVVDHKIPREWGGRTEAENLWALCEGCNAGKKNYFQSVDAEWMRRVVAYDSVHVRLGETLKAFSPEAVSATTLEFVANQDDWKKRTRELRYLDWQIDVSRSKIAGGRQRSFYRLVEARPWPEDPTGVIRRYELERAQRNRHQKG